MQAQHGWLRRFAGIMPKVRLSPFDCASRFHAPQFRTRLICILIMLVGLWLVDEIKAQKRSVLLDFAPTNGTFQNFNPVRRLQSGQTMFADFYPYLGNGPTLLTYAAVRIEGDNLYASIHSLEALAGILHVIALVMMARLFRLSWFSSIAIAAIVVLAGERLSRGMNPAAMVYSNNWISQVHSIFYMTQSSLPLRAAAPIFLTMFLMMRHRLTQSEIGNAWIDGTAAGLSLIWSNDYGVPTFFVFMVLFGLLAPRLTWLERMKRVFKVVAGGLAAAAAGITIVTRGQPWKWLQYNAGVAEDQFWYYEGTKVLQLSEIPVPAYVIVGLTVTAILFIDLLRTQSFATRCMLLLLVTPLIAGYLSSFGGHYEKHYFVAFRRSLTFAAPFACLRIGQSIIAYWPHYRNELRTFLSRLGSTSTAQRLAVVAQVLLTLVIFGEVHRAHRYLKAQTRLPHDTFLVPELGGPMTDQWSKMVAIAREFREEAESCGRANFMFSTYATSFETIAGCFHPTGHDYIIHALGTKERDRYVESFLATRPRYVVTLRGAWMWEQWVRKMHWDFYRELLRHYEPFDRSNLHVIWKPRHQVREFDDLPIAIRLERISPAEVLLHVELPAHASLADEPHYVEIGLKATGDWVTPRFWNGAWRQRLGVDDEERTSKYYYERSAVPLNRRWRFPVLVRPGQPTRLSLQLKPVEHSRLELNDLSARYVMPSRMFDGFELTRLRASSYSAAGWLNGIRISDHDASIICVADVSDLRDVQPCTKLRFAHSGIRDVIRVEGNQLHLSGPALVPEKDGYPSIIEVLR
jgi:hypothetical protein